LESMKTSLNKIKNLENSHEKYTIFLLDEQGWKYI
jgi:hypothetical protein